MSRLTIGLPVYNGAATLASALDSLLAQTLTDFEIVISDNGSNDETPEICARYAVRDPRIRYTRQATVLAPSMNFRFVLFEANTPFFMWAAADDLWAPTFAERNIAALEADPSLVMSQSRVLFTMRGVPSHMSTGTYPLLGTARENAARYFQNPADNSRYYGVFRTHALQGSFPIRPFHALDWAVSGATLRFGKHNELQDVLMIRDTSDSSAYANAVRRDHRRLLWRTFPLLFMTLYLLRRRLTPLSPALLYHLAKANLYLHFRFGAYRLEALGQRYLATNSLRAALGLKPSHLSQGLLAPGLKARLKRKASGLGRALWRALPFSLSARMRIKLSSFSLLKDHARGMAAFRDWGPEQQAERPSPPKAAANLEFRFQTSANSPTWSVLLVATDFDSTLMTVSALSAVANGTAEIIVLQPIWGDALPLALANLPNVKMLFGAAGTPLAELLDSGVAQARTERLLITSSGAFVTSGFFEAAAAGLDAAPIVAPLVLYPDGRIAAAGGVIALTQAVWRYGRFGDPSAPEHSFARACDFAPFAMITRTESARSLGFSGAYLNLDAAFADFTLRARQIGADCLFWPHAQIACPPPEFVGADVRPPVGWMDDWVTLATRHQRVLELLDAIAAEGRPAHDRGRQRQMLYIDADTPTPDQNAGSIEAVNLIRIFGDLGFRVTFVPESNFIHRGRYTTTLQRLGVECIHYPYSVNIEQVLQRKKYDVVVLCRAYIAERYTELVRAFQPNARIIFNTVDLHYLREAREAEMAKDAQLIERANRSKKSELASINAADATIVLSTHEQDVLRREAPEAKVHVLPLVREIPDHLDAPGFADRQHIIFLGTYQHPPNVDAVIHFVKNIFPLVRTRLPGVEFQIIGSAVTPEVAALACSDVKVLGYVEHLEPILKTARIAVAPLRFGAGLKGKVATTMQAGVPSVISPIAAEGMPITAGRDALVAESPENMADAITRLYTDKELWAAVQANGFTFVRREFSIESNLRRIATILIELGVGDLACERILAEDDLKRGDPVFRPSKFWSALSKIHESHLDELHLLRFKRTLNNTYLQWLPGSFEDTRISTLLNTFSARPSMLPIEVAASAGFDAVLANEVSGYGGFNPFSNPDYHRFYAFYVGLLWYQAELSWPGEVPPQISEPILGSPIAYALRGRVISQDLAQSAIEYARIAQLSSTLNLPLRPTFLEIGAGYGRLAATFLAARRCRYVIVDIPPTILVSKWYLSRIRSDLKIFGLRHFETFDEVADEIEAADIVFLTPNQFTLLPDRFADLSLSISSLHEMSLPQIDRYKSLMTRTTRAAIYLKQWRSWRNPIDGIDVGRDLYEFDAPWMLSLESLDPTNEEFVELGWLHTDEVARISSRTGLVAHA